MSGLQAIAVQHGQTVAAQVGDRVRVSVLRGRGCGMSIV